MPFRLLQITLKRVLLRITPDHKSCFNSGSRPKLACEISADRVIAARVSDNGGRSLEACATSELAPGSVIPDLTETNVRQPRWCQ